MLEAIPARNFAEVMFYEQSLNSFVIFLFLSVSYILGVKYKCVKLFLAFLKTDLVVMVGQ